jgi:hypothetical protein
MRRISAILAAILLALAVTEAQEKTIAKPDDTAEKALIAKLLGVMEAENKRQAEEILKMLVANERALHRAVASSDKASFQSLVLPEGVWTTRQGFVPMKLLADGLDDFKLTKWDIANPHVTSLDTDSAILLYVWTGTGTFHNQPLASTTLASTVWTRRNGKWLAVHHQQTDLARN